MIRHGFHVKDRLLERYGIKATDEELIEVEDAIGSLDYHQYFYPRKDHVVGIMFWWKEKLINAIFSCSSKRKNHKHWLTVLPM